MGTGSVGMRIVGADWVADRLGELTIVDVRDPWEYDGIGHLPGAVNIPFDRYRGEEGEAGKLPGAAAFAALAGEAGLTQNSDVLAYDDTHGVFAARFLVTCELYDHDPDRLYLLDGDYSAWTRERATTTGTSEATPAEYEASFIGLGRGPLVGLEAVRAAMDDPGSVLVDTREGWEYEEGHIPGAVRLDWRELVDEESRGVRPEPELRALLEERGVTPDQRVVLYCNTARRISHTYVVLRHLGYPEVAFYEGSLTEWEERGGTMA